MTHLTAYRVAPQMERKARDELHQHGIKARLPRERDCKGRTPIARGYVFAAYKPAFAKHVKSRVGAVTAAELLRLYRKRQMRAADVQCPYSVGQSVFRGEVPGKVLEIRGRTCIIETTMLGKPHTQAIPYAQLRPG